MSRAVWAGALIVFVLLIPAWGDSPEREASTTEHSLTFLASPDAPGTVDQERVHACLRLLLREMNLDGKELPHIVVLHASKKVAHAAAIQETSIRRSALASGNEAFFEFWIVGQPKLSDYAGALFNILEQHFALKVAQSDRKQIMVRVFRYLQNTVAAYPNG